MYVVFEIEKEGETSYSFSFDTVYLRPVCQDENLLFWQKIILHFSSLPCTMIIVVQTMNVLLLPFFIIRNKLRFYAWNIWI